MTSYRPRQQESVTARLEEILSRLSSLFSLIHEADLRSLVTAWRCRTLQSSTSPFTVTVWKKDKLQDVHSARQVKSTKSSTFNHLRIVKCGVSEVIADTYINPMHTDSYIITPKPWKMEDSASFPDFPSGYHGSMADWMEIRKHGRKEISISVM